MLRTQPLPASLALAIAALAASPVREAHAEPPPDAATEPGPADADAAELERVHRESLHTRRLLADAVLVAGLGSVAAGGVLIIPDAEDQAFRFAGINTAVFGAVNTLVGVLALVGIAREEERWGSTEARAARRRSPDGLARARMHASIDERRETAGRALNLGLGFAYAGVAGTAILASQLGVDHPNRWLGSGVAIGVQALFLIAVDYIGLERSAAYHRALVGGFAPAVSIAPSPRGTETQVGVGVRF